MACVCSGTIFLSLGSFLGLGTLTSLGPRLCIRQWAHPGRAPLRQGVPLPVTPWQGDFFDCLRAATSWRSRETSARRAWRSMVWFGFGGVEEDLGDLTEFCDHLKALSHPPFRLYISRNMTCVSGGLCCNPSLRLKPAIAKI